MRGSGPACDHQIVTTSSAPTATPAAAVPIPPPPRRLVRVSHGRLLAGVARGLAEHLGVDVLMIRVLFVVLAFAGGAGFLMYGAFWVFAPLEVRQEDAVLGRVWRERDLGMLLALGSLALGGALILSALGIGISPGWAVPLVVVGVGVVILWRQADDSQRERWRSATGDPPAARPGASRTRHHPGADRWRRDPDRAGRPEGDVRRPGRQRSSSPSGSGW